MKEVVYDMTLKEGARILVGNWDVKRIRGRGWSRWKIQQK